MSNFEDYGIVIKVSKSMKSNGKLLNVFFLLLQLSLKFIDTEEFQR